MLDKRHRAKDIKINDVEVCTRDESSLVGFLHHFLMNQSPHKALSVKTLNIYLVICFDVLAIVNAVKSQHELRDILILGFNQPKIRASGSD